MRVLWLINQPLPQVCDRLNISKSNKEGWISGLLSSVAKNTPRDFELSVAFPVNKEKDDFLVNIDNVDYYGFYEDTTHPEIYDPSIEDRLKGIVTRVNPDVIHIFGTEYPHTLAMCRVCREEERPILIAMQGVMSEIADHYLDGVPEKVISNNSFRDFIKKDGLKEQKKKFGMRAAHEHEALKLVQFIAGRTPLDKEQSKKVNPNSKYFYLGENLRDTFYSDEWNIEKIEKHSIFFSQANYPVKGFHYLLMALPKLICTFPDIKVYVAGDNITRHGTTKEKLKLSSYGKYLLTLINKNKLEEHVVFLGSITAEEVKERLLKSNLFVCTSTMENSPNSLGEAMILGVPSVTTDVGGIKGIFESDVDGMMFMDGNTDDMVMKISKMFNDEELLQETARNARNHALNTHNKENNYKRLVEIYKEIKQ